MRRAGSGSGGRRGHLVVYGNGQLARRIVGELVAWFDQEVTVIVPEGRGGAARFEGLADVRVIQGQGLADEALRAADVATARGLAVLVDDPVTNARVALQARSLKTDLRVVIRTPGSASGGHAGSVVADGIALSAAELAAPLFAAAGLGDAAPQHAQLPGHVLYVRRRYEVPAGQVLCGLADYRRSDRLRLVPAGDPDAELVVALASGAPPAPRGSSPRPRGPAVTLWGRVHLLVSRKLRAAFLTLLGLLVLGTVLLRAAGGYSWADAIYLTVLDAAGSANPQTSLSAAVKVTQVMVTLTGIALIPVLIAAAVDAAVAARLRRMTAGHIIVAGLGETGTRVLSLLHEQGIPVLGIDRDPGAPGITLARHLGVPTVAADRCRDSTWTAASASTARAVLALTGTDVTNYEAALRARAIRPDLPLVLRIFDDDLAEQAQRDLGLATSLSMARWPPPRSPPPWPASR